ncbi:hypothetical protein B4U80_12898 [Leptotrombidium deliense]|uniref:Uncharacterized protein n=1 Tax=Leptotrombidium deliense TaxID=299467 RepID=A0A443SHW4_9ACAR|nr:hypothetical protein B4U80_12898 [Leptotrombidium deliense]
MEKNAFGTKEVAVIRYFGDFSDDLSPLDFIFNVLDDRNVIVAKTILDNPKNHRYVDLYSMVIGLNRNGKAYGPYRKISSKIEFGEFLRSRGFNITTVTYEEQSKLATDFLNIGNGTIVTGFNEVSFVSRIKAIGVKVKYLNMSELFWDNVGVHAITQVVSRQKI